MLVASDVFTASRSSVRRAIDRRDAGTLADICRRAEARGADWLDLNPGFIKVADREALWSFLVETAEATCSLTLMIDAPDASSLALALSKCTRAPILNMATAAEARLGPVLDLAAHHDLDVVGGLFTDQVPMTAEERLELASFLVGEATARGIDPPRLILDPIVTPLAVPDGERQAAAVLEFLKSVRLAFDDPPRTMIGLSNLTTGSARARSRVAALPFLAAAFGAGLDVVLLNTDDQQLFDMTRLCRVFAGERIFAAEEFP